MVAIMMVVLLGSAALAIDIGYLYVAQTELQRAADAAAMAGVHGLRRTGATATSGYIDPHQVYALATEYAGKNIAAGKSVVLEPATDINIRYLANIHDLQAPLQTISLDNCNAVQVIARRSESNAAGRIPLFFAAAIGIKSSEVSASATAVLNDNFDTYKALYPDPNTLPALPFSVDEQIWKDAIEAGNGSDERGYDELSGSVYNGMDGVLEVKLFPNNSKAPGNFGILNIGRGSLGTSELRDQIVTGINEQDLVSLTGEPMIDFYNSDTDQNVSYQVAGAPGISAGMADALVVGREIGFFLHRTVVESGSNAVYTVVSMRFGRIMKVDISNGPEAALLIQPIPHYGVDVTVSGGAPSTQGLIGHIELVR